MSKLSYHVFVACGTGCSKCSLASDGVAVVCEVCSDGYALVAGICQGINLL